MAESPHFILKNWSEKSDHERRVAGDKSAAKDREEYAYHKWTENKKFVKEGEFKGKNLLEEAEKVIRDTKNK